MFECSAHERLETTECSRSVTHADDTVLDNGDVQSVIGQHTDSKDTATHDQLGSGAKMNIYGCLPDPKAMT